MEYTPQNGVYLVDMWITDKKTILGILILLIVGQFSLFIFPWIQVNFSWVDIPLHLLGGALIVMIFLSFFQIRKEFFDLDKNIIVSFIFAISFMILIGVLWEFYEYIMDYIFKVFLSSNIMTTTLKDTLFDLVNDLLGGIMVAIIYFTSKAPSK